MRTVFILCLSVFSSLALANSRLEKIQDRADAFLLRSGFFFQAPTCPPPAGGNLECIEYVAGSYPTSDDKLKAIKACAGVHSAACVKFVAGMYPTSSERLSAAMSCKNVIDNECVEFVAGMYPTTSERNQAALACQNATGECVKYAAGSYPTTSERIAAAKACGGN